MARSVSDINPNDVFPPRDLPGASENWGRTVEDRLVAVERGVLALQQALAAQGRTFASALASLVDSTQSPGSFTRTLTSQAINSSESSGAGLFTTASVTVPTGATFATITIKGSVTATNDASITPGLTLSVQCTGWYSYLASGVMWEPGLIDSYTPFSGSSETLVPGATATATTQGSTTIPVTAGYEIIAGTDSRFGPTAGLESTNNAKTELVATIAFHYAL